MKKLFSMVLCAMMALTLAGCGGSGDDSSTYTYSSELDIKNLDSADAEDGCSFTALHAIIDGLMKPAKDGTTTYGIAKSSEVSEDGLTHTYKLRDAKWSNGDPVTANDFVYAWHRIFKNKGNYYYMFCDGIANIAGAQELSDKIDAEQDLTDDDLNSLGVKAVDDKTLEVTTTTRVSFFDELMSFPCFYPINEKFAEKQGDKYGKSADSILANGAFTMTKWEPGSVAEFEKNDKFYAAKDVKIDKLVMKLVQEPKVAAQSFEAGETDFAIINSDLVDKYKKDEQKQWEKQIAPYACVKYAKITYVAHNPYEEKFTLVHQIDVKTDSINRRWYRYFVDSSAFTDYSKQSIILLDENKKEIPLQKNVHMMCEKLAEGCGNIVLTFDA